MSCRRILAGAALGAVLTTSLMAQAPRPQSNKAQTFVTKATNGGMYEVESSKQALEKAKDASVKQFAQRMIDDHSKANKEIESIAAKNGVNVPKNLDKAHAAKLKTLSAAKGTAFDRTYVQQQTDAHRQAVTLFRDYAAKGENAELKAFAGQTLPTLESHTKEVQELSRGLKGTPAAKK